MWFFPLDRAASLTMRAFGCALAGALLFFVAGRLLKRRWISRLGIVAALATFACYSCLYLARPAWMRLALDPNSPPPQTAGFTWTTRADGLETAELAISADGHWVDRVALVRIDPGRYRFTVEWDGARPRTIDEWQSTLGAAVVMNGSYFSPDRSPQTPLRSHGRSFGPAEYQSQHAAFAGGDIIDLRGRALPDAIAGFSDAMVSYPTLLDREGHVRVAESDWLASRSFVALDGAGRVLFGTTKTGYFSLQRLGEWLKHAPLDVRVALNLDGGPIASQAVAAPGYSRVVVGSAEINHGADVLRAFWQARRTDHWKLPIVVAAIPK
jgi:hypothetical protein